KEMKWHAALKKPADLVAVAGGDGTVGQVIKQLLRRNVPLAILPLGTANNIANMFAPPGSLEELIASWKNARRISFDIGRVKAPWGSGHFVESFGIGLLAKFLSADKPESVSHPNAQRSCIFQRLSERLQEYPLLRMQAVLDGKDISGDYIALEAMNIRCIGPNLWLAPEAEVDDHLLDLVLVDEAGRKQLAAHLADRVKAKIKPLHLKVLRGKRLQI